MKLRIDRLVGWAFGVAVGTPGRKEFRIDVLVAKWAIKLTLWEFPNKGEEAHAKR
jgi:hypothetical protein